MARAGETCALKPGHKGGHRTRAAIDRRKSADAAAYEARKAGKQRSALPDGIYRVSAREAEKLPDGDYEVRQPKAYRERKTRRTTQVRGDN